MSSEAPANSDELILLPSLPGHIVTTDMVARALEDEHADGVEASEEPLADPTD